MSALPPRPPKKIPVQKKRAPIFFLSALVLVQCGPMLDRVFAPVLDSDLFAAQVAPAMAYEFTVEPSGVVRAECANGTSRVSLIPGGTLSTPDGAFRKLRLQARLCTDFGFKTREKSFYVPTELFRADSDVIQGAWETKTYTGVPSDDNPERTGTIQVRRIASNQLEIISIPEGFEQPDFEPVLISFRQAEDMSMIQDWRSDLLPLKDIRLRVDTPFLSEPVVVYGSLTRVRPASRI